jgi:hypothetical protein
MKVIKNNRITIFIFLLFIFTDQLTNAQIPSCTSDDCGTIEANWELVNDSLIVCEGETFQVSGITSTPLNNIESFHWYFIDNSNLEILFDTLLFTTDDVSFTYDNESEAPCQNDNPTVDLLISLVVTSPACDNGMTSCNWKLSSVIIELNPVSHFSMPGTACQPNLIPFQNQSCFEGAYLWDFGDGATSTFPNLATIARGLIS